MIEVFSVRAKEPRVIIKMFKDDISRTHTVIRESCNLVKRWVVKIINVDYADLRLLHKTIEEMNKGDILIAETTSPELIVACRKAAAIVTDSSAAYCLTLQLSVGNLEYLYRWYENATKVFRDGDIVEVDTKNGTVTKIRIDKVSSYFSASLYKTYH